MSERRKFPRLSVNVAISYDCYNDDGEIVEQNIGTILDVSEGGILVESDALIEANYIEIMFFGFDNKLHSIVGSAVHSRKIDNGKVKTGICFHGKAQSNRAFTTAVIRTHFYARKAS